jgi:DNA-binding CsgD family transcriptional regulator
MTAEAARLVPPVGSGKDMVGRRGVVPLALSVGVLSLALAGYDLWVEGEPFAPGDFVFEVLDRALLLGAVVAVAWTTAALRELRREQAEMREDLARAVAMGREWREASSTTLSDLGGAIQRQFEAWSLSRAEADIAGLMLKGVPLRGIAELRHTSETTIRQQAQAIYRKSGLSGRAELSAYFLESLFEVRQAAGAVRQP